LNQNYKYYFFISVVLVVLLFVLDILIGSVAIPWDTTLNILIGKSIENTAWKTILIDFRLPKAITALFAGVALSVSGLQMQTLFRNSLAGPYVLGVTSGASMGVALVLLVSSYSGFIVLSDITGSIGIVGAAFTGGMLVLLLILWVSLRISNNTTILILGLMFGHFTNAIVGVLQYFSQAQDLKGFIIWSMGSFGNVVWNELFVLIPIVIVAFIIAYALSKQLNILLLGESYAKSMGVNVTTSRFNIIVSTGLLSASVTAFCGPVAFLGLAIPHLVRNTFVTADHRILIPATAIWGAMFALLCDIIAQLPGTGETLPINAITSIVGAPVVVWVIIKNRKY